MLKILGDTMTEIINKEAFNNCWKEVIPGFDDGVYGCISKDNVKDIWIFCEQAMYLRISELEKQISGKEEIKVPAILELLTRENFVKILSVRAEHKSSMQKKEISVKLKDKIYDGEATLVVVFK
jgi:hypothetical protein